LNQIRGDNPAVRRVIVLKERAEQIGECGTCLHSTAEAEKPAEICPSLRRRQGQRDLMADVFAKFVDLVACGECTVSLGQYSLRFGQRRQTTFSEYVVNRSAVTQVEEVTA
jgi:hypothetical protein